MPLWASCTISQTYMWNYCRTQWVWLPARPFSKLGRVVIQMLRRTHCQRASPSVGWHQANEQGDCVQYNTAPCVLETAFMVHKCICKAFFATSPQLLPAAWVAQANSRNNSTRCCSHLVLFHVLLHWLSRIMLVDVCLGSSLAEGCQLPNFPHLDLR